MSGRLVYEGLMMRREDRWEEDLVAPGCEKSVELGRRGWSECCKGWKRMSVSIPSPDMVTIEAIRAPSHINTMKELSGNILFAF